MYQNPVHVFVVHTPLHILLAINLIKSSRDNAEPIILVLDDFQAAPILVKLLRNFSGMECQIHLVPGQYGLDSFFRWKLPDKSIFVKLRRHLTALMAIRVARHVYRNLPVEKLYIFNDIRGEVQVFINDISKTNKPEILLVDDGFAPYRTNPEGKRNNLLSFIYGNAWYPTRSYGEYPLITGALLMYPEFANMYLKKKRLLKMPPFGLDLSELTTLINAFNPSEGTLLTLTDDRSKALLCLPHSELKLDEQTMKSWVMRINEQYESSETDVVIKYHPREQTEDYLHLKSERSLKFVDRHIPAEIICAFLRERIRAVYAEASSVLITIPWIDDSAQVYSIDSGAEWLSQELLSLIEEIGISEINFSDRVA